MNSPGGNTVSTAELTMALLLAVARPIAAADAAMKARALGPQGVRRRRAVRQAARRRRARAGSAARSPRAAARSAWTSLGYDPFVAPAVAGAARRQAAWPSTSCWPAADFVTPARGAQPGDAAPDRQGGAREGQARHPHRQRGARRADRRGGAAARRSRAGASPAPALDVHAQEPPKDWGLAKHPQVVADAAHRRADARGAGARGDRHRGPGARLPEGRRDPAGGELLLALGRAVRPGASRRWTWPSGWARSWRRSAAAATSASSSALYGELRELDAKPILQAAVAGDRCARAAPTPT